MIDWLRWIFRKPQEPDTDRLHDWTDRTPIDADCPTTQPTNPGALESDT